MGLGSRSAAVAPALPIHLKIGLATRVFYFLACAVSFVLLLAFVARIVWNAELTWHCVFAVPAGMAFADLVSGLIHWSADTWGRVSMPVLGKRLLHPFRVHHINPADFLRRRFFDTNGDVAALATPALLAAFWIPLDSTASVFWAVFVAAMSAVGLMTNQIHQWAHMREAPWPIRHLQRVGFILSYEAHALHHRPPHMTNYCIATGWCNPPLRALRFFARLESLITRCTGLQPRSDENAFAASAATREPSEVARRGPASRCG